jgi:hypothetical protein
VALKVAAVERCVRFCAGSANLSLLAAFSKATLHAARLAAEPSQRARST